MPTERWAMERHTSLIASPLNLMRRTSAPLFAVTHDLMRRTSAPLFAATQDLMRRTSAPLSAAELDLMRRTSEPTLWPFGHASACPSNKSAQSQALEDRWDSDLRAKKTQK